MPQKSLTQYDQSDVKTDDTRDAAYDLYALIGAARRAAMYLNSSDLTQDRMLSATVESLMQAHESITGFIKQRRG